MAHPVKLLDVTPDVSQVDAIAGASLTLELTLIDPGRAFTGATHAASAELLPYRGAVPPVTSMVAAWLPVVAPALPVLTLSLTAAQTAQLLGSFGFAVWLEDLSDATQRVCIMRGRLTFEVPA